eukprot:504622_1
MKICRLTNALCAVIFITILSQIMFVIKSNYVLNVSDKQNEITYDLMFLNKQLETNNVNIWWNNLQSIFPIPRINDTKYDITKATVILNLSYLAFPITFDIFVMNGRHDLISLVLKQWAHFWEKQVTIILDSKHKGNCLNHDKHCLFIDIGANLGYHSLVMAYLGYDVIAFEAYDENYEIFYKSLYELNPNLLNKITIIPFGLSNFTEKTICDIWSMAINSQNGVILCDKLYVKHMYDFVHDRAMNMIKRKRIEMHRLDDILLKYYPNHMRNNAYKITAMKIDIEGHESYALEPIKYLFNQQKIEIFVAECSEKTALFFQSLLHNYVVNQTLLSRCFQGIGADIYAIIKPK